MPGPRLNHKKSRNGCQRCKARRVKVSTRISPPYFLLTKHVTQCDEARPVCGSCHRHKVSCLYGQSFTQSTGPSRADQNIIGECSSTTSTTDSVNHNPDIIIPRPNLDTAGNIDLPESAARRHLELRLLHHYIVSTSATFPATHIANVRAAWTINVPQLANRHPSLLYALFSVAALHLSTIEPHNHELSAAHTTYFDLAVSAHLRAVVSFDAATVDPVCFTSILILLNAFAKLQGRVHGPEYEPPILWLEMSHGAWKVFKIAWQWIKEGSTAVVTALIRSAPMLSDHASLFSENNREEFSELLAPLTSGSPYQNRENNEDLDNPETREAYEKTVAYIGSIRKALQSKEHSLVIHRLLLAFAVVLPGKMVELIKMKKPRALVVLAHYFALVGPMASDAETVWWVGPIARKEVEGIQRCLPDEWQELMRWPLAMTTEMATEG